MEKDRILGGMFGACLGAFLVALGPSHVAAQMQFSNTAPDGTPAKQANSVSAAESDGDYRVGAGDSIQVYVWKEPDISTTVVVRPDGKISVPLVNDLLVMGRTPLEIKEMVAGRLSPFINDPNVTITVREIRSKKVYALGMVNRTGSYQIVQPTTVLQVLTEAGGLQPFAKEDSIYILRVENGRQTKFPFRYKEVVQGKNIEQNIILQPGDTIVVP
jgi:polysaccharide export outer membrane protein